MDYKKYIDDFCKKEDIKINYSSDMPKGYEDAFGTFDIILNTLFINEKEAENFPEYERLFYLFHELRHACQYIHPEKFSEEVQKSRFYVILYNGSCFRLFEKEWKECKIDVSEDYFESLYRNLPYEKDANMFAYMKTKEVLGDSDGLRALYSFWIPGCNLGIEDYEKVFREIDNKCR